MSAAVDAAADGGPATADRIRPPGGRFGGRPVGPLLTILAAVLLPPVRTAGLLVGPDSPLFDRVVAGVWVLKVLLIVHAVALPLLARVFATRDPGRPLIRRIRGREPISPTRVGLLFSAIIIGLGLRLVDLGAGLWHDEIATLVEYGRLPIGQIIATYNAQNQHVLYSVLTSLTFAIFGESAWALRLPAVVLGVMSLPVVFWFGSIITSRREALIATLLLTVSYHHIWFSQNARGYTGMMLFALLGTGLFIRLLTGGSRRAWPTIVAYAVFMALAVWTHLTAAFIAVAHASIWGVLAIRYRSRAKGTWPWAPAVAVVLAGTFTLLLYSLVIPQMAETLFTPATKFAGETPWQNPLWLAAATVRGAAHGLPGGWVGLAAGATVALAGTVSYLRRSATVTWLMLLPGVITAAALIATAHNLWPRFFFFAAGFAVLIAVRGTFALADLIPVRQRYRRRIATVGLTLAILASATTVPRAWAPKQDYAGALGWVRNESGPRDAIVAVGLAAYAYEAWLHSRRVMAVTDTAGLGAIERSHGVTWLLYTMPDHLAGQSPELWARIEHDYREIIAFPGTVAGGTVHVLQKR